jgi:hypothetical protein
MGFLWNSTILLGVYIIIDKVISLLVVNAGYYSLGDMFEEFYTNQQDLTDVLFRLNTAWQVIPLFLAFYITPIVRKCI